MQRAYPGQAPYHAYQAAPHSYPAQPAYAYQQHAQQQAHNYPQQHQHHPGFPYQSSGRHPYPYVQAPQSMPHTAREGIQNFMRSEWSSQFGPTLVFMLIVAALLWFKVYGAEIVGDKAQSELLQAGVLVGAVVLVLSVAVNLIGQSAGITALDMVWIHMALVLIACVLLWNHVAHIVAINARPPPEEEKRSSNSRSATSKPSSSSSSSSSSGSGSRSSASREAGSSSFRPSSSSSSSRLPSSSSSSSTGSRPSSSSSSSRDLPKSSSTSSSSSSSASAKATSSSGSRSSSSGAVPSPSSRSSSSRGSTSKDKEPEKEEVADHWGKAHPSANLSKPRPNLWPFPIGLARPASKENDGKERTWWESGMPHQVGYIDRGDGQNVGEVPAEDKGNISSSSKVSSSTSSPPTDEEVVELKAILKGEKELSKDKDKRARQKELIKSMTEKKSSSGDKGDTSGRSVAADSSVSTPTPPTAEELAEIKAIMKGQRDLSTEKAKRTRQKELIKMISVKKTEGAKPPSTSDEAAMSPPTDEELKELQDIVQGKAKLSEDKEKRARQKALIKMMTGGGTAVGAAPAKRGVRFDDQEGMKPSGSHGSSGAKAPGSSSRPASSRSGSGSGSGSGIDPVTQNSGVDKE